MREPGNRGITGQQPPGINRSFHYLLLKGLKTALKYCICERLRLKSSFLSPLSVQSEWRGFIKALTAMKTVRA